jgi:hypothetical protein
MPSLSAIGVAAMLAPTEVEAGNCLSRPAPFVLQSDIVEWSMVVGRGSECIQGLRGRTMVLESVSVLEQPESGQIILQGPSFRYSAGSEPADLFKILPSAIRRSVDPVAVAIYSQIQLEGHPG